MSSNNNSNAEGPQAIIGTRTFLIEANMSENISGSTSRNSSELNAAFTTTADFQLERGDRVSVEMSAVSARGAGSQQQTIEFTKDNVLQNGRKTNICDDRVVLEVAFYIAHNGQNSIGLPFEMPSNTGNIKINNPEDVGVKPAAVYGNKRIQVQTAHDPKVGLCNMGRWVTPNGAANLFPDPLTGAANMYTGTAMGTMPCLGWSGDKNFAYVIYGWYNPANVFSGGAIPAGSQVRAIVLAKPGDAGTNPAGVFPVAGATNGWGIKYSYLKKQYTGAGGTNGGQGLFVWNAPLDVTGDADFASSGCINYGYNYSGIQVLVPDTGGDALSQQYDQTYTKIDENAADDRVKIEFNIQQALPQNYPISPANPINMGSPCWLEPLSEYQPYGHIDDGEFNGDNNNFTIKDQPTAGEGFTNNMWLGGGRGLYYMSSIWGKDGSISSYTPPCDTGGANNVGGPVFKPYNLRQQLDNCPYILTRNDFQGTRVAPNGVGFTPKLEPLTAFIELSVDDLVIADATTLAGKITEKLHTRLATWGLNSDEYQLLVNYPANYTGSNAGAFGRSGQIPFVQNYGFFNEDDIILAGGNAADYNALPIDFKHIWNDIAKIYVGPCIKTLPANLNVMPNYFQGNINTSISGLVSQGSQLAQPIVDERDYLSFGDKSEVWNNQIQGCMGIKNFNKAWGGDRLLRCETWDGSTQTHQNGGLTERNFGTPVVLNTQLQNLYFEEEFVNPGGAGNQKIIRPYVILKRFQPIFTNMVYNDANLQSIQEAFRKAENIGQNNYQQNTFDPRTNTEFSEWVNWFYEMDVGRSDDYRSNFGIQNIGNNPQTAKVIYELLPYCLTGRLNAAGIGTGNTTPPAALVENSVNPPPAPPGVVQQGQFTTKNGITYDATGVFANDSPRVTTPATPITSGGISSSFDYWKKVRGGGNVRVCSRYGNTKYVDGVTPQSLFDVMIEQNYPFETACFFKPTEKKMNDDNGLKYNIGCCSYYYKDEDNEIQGPFIAFGSWKDYSPITQNASTFEFLSMCWGNYFGYSPSKLDNFAIIPGNFDNKQLLTTTIPGVADPVPPYRHNPINCNMIVQVGAANPTCTFNSVANRFEFSYLHNPVQLQNYAAQRSNQPTSGGNPVEITNLPQAGTECARINVAPNDDIVPYPYYQFNYDGAAHSSSTTNQQLGIMDRISGLAIWNIWLPSADWTPPIGVSLTSYWNNGKSSMQTYTQPERIPPVRSSTEYNHNLITQSLTKATSENFTNSFLNKLGFEYEDLMPQSGQQYFRFSPFTFNKTTNSMAGLGVRPLMTNEELDIAQDADMNIYYVPGTTSAVEGKKGVPAYGLGFLNNQSVNIETTSAVISASNPPNSAAAPYFLILSDIIPTNYQDGRTSLPCIFYCLKNYGSQGYYYSYSSTYNQVCDYPRTITKISTEIRNPTNSQLCKINDGTIIVYKVERDIRVPFPGIGHDDVETPQEKTSHSADDKLDDILKEIKDDEGQVKAEIVNQYKVSAQELLDLGLVGESPQDIFNQGHNIHHYEDEDINIRLNRRQGKGSVRVEPGELSKIHERSGDDVLQLEAEIDRLLRKAESEDLNAKEKKQLDNLQAQQDQIQELEEQKSSDVRKHKGMVGHEREADIIEIENRFRKVLLNEIIKKTLSSIPTYWTDTMDKSFGLFSETIKRVVVEAFNEYDEKIKAIGSAENPERKAQLIEQTILQQLDSGGDFRIGRRGQKVGSASYNKILRGVDKKGGRKDLRISDAFIQHLEQVILESGIKGGILNIQQTDDGGFYVKDLDKERFNEILLRGIEGGEIGFVSPSSDVALQFAEGSGKMTKEERKAQELSYLASIPNQAPQFMERIKEDTPEEIIHMMDMHQRTMKSSEEAGKRAAAARGIERDSWNQMSPEEQEMVMRRHDSYLKTRRAEAEEGLQREGRTQRDVIAAMGGTRSKEKKKTGVEEDEPKTAKK